MFTCAPPSSRMFTSSNRPAATANMSAVLPSLFCASTSAFSLSSARRCWERLPRMAATISAVSPAALVAFGSACPCSNSMFKMSSLPNLTAIMTRGSSKGSCATQDRCGRVNSGHSLVATNTSTLRPTLRAAALVHEAVPIRRSSFPTHGCRLAGARKSQTHQRAPPPVTPSSRSRADSEGSTLPHDKQHHTAHAGLVRRPQPTTPTSHNDSELHDMWWQSTEPGRGQWRAHAPDQTTSPGF